MTKEEYLQQLENLLNIEGIEDVDKIIEKYRKRFDLAYAADMTVDEAIRMLGMPSEVVKKYAKPKSEDTSEEKIIYNLSIQSPIAINRVSITRIKGDSIIVNVDEELIGYVNVNYDNNSILISDKITKYSFKNKHGYVSIKIGDKIVFDEIKFMSTNCDYDIDDIEGKKITIMSTNGDFKFKNINFEKMNIDNVNGDLNIRKLICKNVKIATVCGDVSVQYAGVKNIDLSTVSGDIKVDYVDAEFAKLDTINGDIELTGKILNKKTSSVTGDIILNIIKEV